MSFSIRFESAGDGTPENLERVRRGLEETLGIPAATVERMLAHAPVTVRNGLSEEQARQFARMLESVGAVVSVIGPSAPPPDASRKPVETHAEPEWWERLSVYSPPFDPTAPAVMSMTAATCRARGESLFLGHPQLSSVEIAEIRLVSIFKLEDERWFIDLYCRNQVRPVRLNAANVDFASFGVSPDAQRAEAVGELLRFLLDGAPSILTDLTTFRFLRDAGSVRLFPELRAVEAYQARLTADLLTMPAGSLPLSFLTGSEAEFYRELEDPWAGSDKPSAAPEGFPSSPEWGNPAKTQYVPSPAAPPQPPPFFQSPPPAMYPPPDAPPIHPPFPQYPAETAPSPYPFPQPEFAPPRFVPPPFQPPPGAKNYWSAAHASISLLPQIFLCIQLGLQGISLLAEVSGPARFKNLTALLLARGMSIGFYILTILFIRAGERKAAFAFLVALFFELFVLVLGGYFFTLVAGAIVGLILLAWVIRESLE